MKNRSIWLVSILFFFSGLSSLVYQVLWTRSMVFVFGSSQFATSTVLSVFMAGLALGSYFAGRLSDKHKFNSLKLYGILEAVIGIWALLAPFLFSAAVPLYQASFQPFHLQPILFGLLRFSVAALILLPPTTCMGATLPILSKYVTERIEIAGNRVGTLYALNTLGAVLGCISGGFLLLPTLGLSKTTALAAAINIMLFICAWFLSKTSPNAVAGEGETQSDTESIIQSEHEPMSRLGQVVMISFSISGALAMFYEVGWTRILLMLIGSTTYAFTLMLSAFLLGIFLGSLLCARIIDKMKSPISLFCIGQIYLCFAGLFALSIFNFLPYWNLAIASVVGSSELSSLLLRFSAAALILMPITLCLGALFPIAVKICADDINKIAGSVGKLYAMNTCGAIIGAVAAGFFFIPLFGAEQSMVLASVANVMLGVVLFLSFIPGRRALKISSLILTIALAAWALSKPELIDRKVLLFAQYERRQLAASLSRLFRGGQIPSFEDWKKTLNKRILFYEDGMCASVAIAQTESPVTNLLFTNGHCDASDGGDMENQAMLALLPLSFNRQAKTICNVGWGSGVTVGYALQFPVSTVTCAEIEPAVLDASAYFSHVNFNALGDKRSTVEPSDGRNYLLSTPEKFDVIISEPSNPWQSGVCNLFTREYFKIAADRLNPGGVFSMWCQLNEVSPKNLQQIISALHSVFPHVYLFDSGSGDMCAIATKDRLKIPYDKMQAFLSDKKYAQLYGRFGIKNANDYCGRILVCPDSIDKLSSSEDMNSDDLNHLEFDVAKSYESKRYHKEDEDWLLSNAGPIWASIDFGGRDELQKAETMAEIGVSSLSRNTPRGLLWLEESMRLRPNPTALAALIESSILLSDQKRADALFAQANKLFPNDARFSNLKAMQASLQNNYAESRAHLALAIQQNPSKSLYRLRMAETYSTVNTCPDTMWYQAPSDPDPLKVIQFAQPLLIDTEFLKTHESAFIILADAYIKLNKPDEALNLVESGRKLIPNCYRLLRYQSRAFALKKQWAQSEFCIEKYRELSRPYLLAQYRKADLALAKGDDNAALIHFQKCFESFPGDAILMRKVSALAGNKRADQLLDQQKELSAL